ncbi:2OG-Fe(II) oxygenase [Thiosulfativibrio zosterae]|uniref:Prolyl 4-hydroxylase subunit alpha n=1 Tax=Thiosulfativibrio zosterae TaxID=2675053 RepID=A0A6F8PJU2_9GAMM|nr:2OG-Fe(II) oxygenase [Thiosulfativibrio zosterae]BBP42270.1 prolyl 4-hydroxylase subunit alpha [Thiosulfativibrio zosterae]
MSLNLTENILDSLLDALVEQGWFEWPNAVDEDLCLELLAEVESLDEEGELRRAGIGRGDALQLNKDIRRDQIKWLDNSTPPQQRYLKHMANLQCQLNRALFLGLFEYESHFALYKKGDFYKKHLDSFRGKANRMVTTVLYLNPDWQAEWGGQLVIYNEDSSQKLATINPRIGKMVVFMSEQIPHEVLPTLHPRVSIAGWFRLNNSIAGAIDPAF